MTVLPWEKRRVERKNAEGRRKCPGCLLHTQRVRIDLRCVNSSAQGDSWPRVCEISPAALRRASGLCLPHGMFQDLHPGLVGARLAPQCRNSSRDRDSRRSCTGHRAEPPPLGLHTDSAVPLDTGLLGLQSKGTLRLCSQDWT